MRSKYYLLINILGLVLGISCSLLAFSFVLNEFRYDEYHNDSDQIYRVTCSTIIDDQRTEFANMPPAFGPAIKESIPEIEYMARLSLPFPINNGLSKIKFDDREFYQANIYMADSTIFDILSYQFIMGVPASIREPNAIIVSNELAEKLFGKEYRSREDLIGIAIEIDNVEFSLVGVIENAPGYSHIRPDGFISWTGLGQDDIWDDSQAYTYVKLHSDFNIAEFDKKLQLLVDENQNIQDAGERFGAQVEIKSQRINEIHLHSNKQNEASNNANWAYIYAYIIIAIFFTLSSSVNYLNLSIAISQKRFKEVGIRKVLGADAVSIKVQFFWESVILTVSAVLLSICFFYLLLPAFSQLMNYPVDGTIILYPKFILTAVAIMVTIIAVAGVYPSVYLSRLNPVDILKSRFTATREKIPLRKVLIVFQFFISSLMITAIIAISTQINYLTDRNLGFNKENVIVIKIPDSEISRLNLRAFKSSIENISKVMNTSVSDFLPGTTSMIDEHYVERKNGEMKSSTVARIFADADFLKTLSLDIVNGRDFDPLNQADAANAFLVNEAAVRFYGWDQSSEGPIGKSIDGFNYHKKGKVIGVFRDANLFSLKESIKPLILNLSNTGSYLYVRVFNSESVVIEKIKSKFKTTFDGYPFYYVYLNEAYSKLYNQDRQLKSAMQAGTIVLIFISCLGLLGLSTFHMNQHMKEIGVRKVLGANTRQIIVYFGADFVKLILIANVIAFPVALFYLNNFLQEYAYHIPLYWWLFVIPFFATVILTISTVSFTIIRAASVDPVKILKYE